MKVAFLHYVWQYKKFAFSNLTTVSGDLRTIVQVGRYLKEAGPNFFTAPVVMQSLVALLPTLVPEKNRVMEKFATFGVPARDAFARTALLQLKQVYYHQAQCMHGAIGLQLLKF